MLLTVAIQGPAGHEESVAVDAHGANLAYLLQQYAPAVDACLINGRLVAEWQKYIPQKHDRVRLVLAIQEPISLTSFFVGLGLSVTAATVASAVTNIVIGLAISMALSAAIRALTPNPKAPKLDGAAGQAFGTTGFNNTTGQGVPIPVWYGEQRVWGHVIASGAELSTDYTVMQAKILYCLGDSGGDGYEEIFDVLIDRVPASQYNGVQIHTRMGSLTQSVIPEFNNVSNLFTDARTIVYDETKEEGTALLYTTHGNNVQRIKLILQFPAGLYRINKTGNLRADFVQLRIEFKRESDPEGNYVALPSLDTASFLWHIEASNRSAFFHDIIVDTSAISPAAAAQYWAERPDVGADDYYGAYPLRAYEHWIQWGQHEPTPSATTGRPVVWHSELSEADQWELRITIASAGGGPVSESHANTVILFNVEETTFTTTNYPGYVLLGITGLQGNQVRNLQAVEVSAFVRGKRVKSPIAAGGALAYSRSRPEIVRDIMTHPTVGMGYEFDESEIDDLQWHFDGAVYYNEPVAAQGGGTEQRDLCDVGITERRWDWDWVKRVASEGRACIVPSGLKWKYLVDKPGNANLLLAEPGNIIEGSISMEISPPDDPFNQIVGQYRDASADFISSLSQPIDSINPGTSVNQKVVAYESITRESEVLRENMIQMKRQDLERRRWQLVSPSSMLVGEPMDLDWLSERTIGDIGAFAGVLPAGSTIGSMVLPYTIELESGKNYLAIVQHKGLSMAETRLVLTGPGHWNQIALVTAFDVAPEEGAVFAIGEQTIDHIVTRARDFQIDDNGRVTQLRTEYIAEVYNPDPLPPSLARNRFPLSTVPPIPLLDATVYNQLVQKLDGSWVSIIFFDVTPGLAVHAGVMRNNAFPDLPIDVPGLGPVATTSITLDFTEPTIPEQVNYYKGAYLALIDGAFAGQEREILFYDSPTRVAVCREFPGLPINGTMYQIRWVTFGETHGFKIEISTDRLHWSELARPVGTHYERDGGDQGGTWWYQFKPYNQSGVFNNFAPIIKQFILGGDTVAPPPAVSVSAWATLSIATVEAIFAVPTALDFAGIEVQIVQFEFVDTGSGVIRNEIGEVALARIGVSSALVGQTGNTRSMFDMSNTNPNYNLLFFARVRALDYTGNESAWVQSNDFTLQQITAADIA